MAKPSGEFIINFPGPLEDIFNSQDAKYVEIYVSTRGRVDQIAYGKPDNERINIKHLTLAYRIPCHIYPDPRTEIEDAKDREEYEMAKAAEFARKEEERKQKEVDEQMRKEEKINRMKKLEEATQQRGQGFDSDMGGTDDEGSSKHSSHGDSAGESSNPKSGAKSSGMASGMDSNEEEESESEPEGDQSEG